MLKLSLDNLQNFLQQKNYNAQIQAQTSQVFLTFKIVHREFPLFARILAESQLLQLITFIPCNFTPNTLANVARLLHLLNKDMDLPGFCMDEGPGVIFYRYIIHTPNQEIDENLLENYLNSIQLICQSFSAAIIGVATGTMTVEQVFKRVQEQKSTKPKSNYNV